MNEDALAKIILNMMGFVEHKNNLLGEISEELARLHCDSNNQNELYESSIYETYPLVNDSGNFAFSVRRHKLTDENIAFIKSLYKGKPIVMEIETTSECEQIWSIEVELEKNKASNESLEFTLVMTHDMVQWTCDITGYSRNKLSEKELEAVAIYYSLAYS
jgi:hypothetical protein